MKKNLIKSFALPLAMVLTLSACSTAKTSSTSPASEQQKTSTSVTPTTIIPVEESNVNPAGVFPIVKNTVEISISLPQPSGAETEYSTNWFTKQIEELTNVKLNWNYINNAAFIENVNLMFASGTLTDVLINGVGAAVRLDKGREGQLANQGMIIPLSGLIEEYAPNIMASFDKQAGMRNFIQQPNGEIYSIPTVDDAYHTAWSAKYWINDTWLKNLNMPYPTTTDELYDTLVAFRDKDPNQNGKKDEIPFSTCKAGNNVLLDIFLMNPFTYSPGPDRLYLKDGKVVFSPTQPGYADGLRYINKLYTEGLIYVDSFSQDQKAQVSLNENGEQAVLGGWPAQHLGYGVDINASKKWQEYQTLPPLKGPNPEGPIASYLPYNKFITGHLVITKAAKTPEVIIRFADYFYDEANVYPSVTGREGIEWKKAEPGEFGLDGVTPAIYKALTVDTKDPKYQNIAWGQMFPNYRPMSFYNSVAYPTNPYDPSVAPGQGRMVVFWAGTKPYEAVSQKLENCLPPLAYDADVTTEVAQLKTTIDQYVNEMLAAFTTGTKSVDKDFDAFINELDKMGLQKYLKIQQDTYDATFGK